ncbi:hypothetical protein [Corynebacterium otitidis]|uniref:hypothetical protein n=1 Tax=Corynebacterium otitidis TaxID=29321 RepID=UPI00062796B9|nr:hypothetical protein [Corynebacterium otitidis]KKO83741.1 hypothetical protein AAV33_04795 [Corynebacterium otitidis]
MKLRYALPAAAAALALSLPATAIAEEAPNAEETQQQVETSQQEGTQQQENENQEPTVQEQIQQDLAEVPGLSEEQIARFNSILEQVAAGALDEDGAIEAVTAGLETNGISRETADYLLAEARKIIDEETVAGYYAIVESELDRLVAIHEANQAPEEEPKEAEISEEEKTEGEAAEESEKKDEEAAKNEQAQPASAEQPAKLANTGVSGALAGVGAGLAALALGGTALVAAQRKNA